MRVTKIFGFHHIIALVKIFLTVVLQSARHICLNRNHWHVSKAIIFSKAYLMIERFVFISTARYKENLFAGLTNMKSNDPQLSRQGKGVLRILEIGLGPAVNLKYYPKGCHLISVDPNKFFGEKNKAKNRHLVFEKHIIAYGEDMSVIEDGSVDVVVATYLLCSVNDAEKVIHEIYRVLSPEGRYFFFEHIGFQNKMYRWIQNLSQPFWSLMFDTCRLNRNCWDYIKDSRFFIEKKEFFLMKKNIFVMWPHVMGIGLKCK